MHGEDILDVKFASDTIPRFLACFSELKAISIDLAGGVEPECVCVCAGKISALLLIFPLHSVSFRRFGSCITFYNHRKAKNTTHGGAKLKLRSGRASAVRGYEKRSQRC